MNCGECGYDLTGLGMPERCPECGTRDWKPQVESPIWIAAQRSAPWLAAVPWIWLGACYGLLLMARLQLGHWPTSRWAPEGPGDIPIVRVLLPAVTTLMLGAFATFATSAGLLAAGVLGTRPTSRAFRTLRRGTVLAVLAWIGAIVLLRLDPVHVHTWLGD